MKKEAERMLNVIKITAYTKERMVCADPKKGLRRPFSNLWHDKIAENLCLKKSIQRSEIMLLCIWSSQHFLLIKCEVCFGRGESGKHALRWELQHQAETRSPGRIVGKRVQQQKSWLCRSTFCYVFEWLRAR